MHRRITGAPRVTSLWTPEAAMLAGQREDLRLPVIAPADVVPIDPDHDVWDMWPLARADGATAIVENREWWFFLAAPRGPDPEGRHDAARIHLYSCGATGWARHGAAFPDGFTPGSREWSGTAILSDDDTTVTMHFTAAGHRDGPPGFAQRLFESTGGFADGQIADWTRPVETARADGHWYRIADQAAPIDDRIKGFRDPGYFRDPATGREHLLFTGSAAWVDAVIDGVIGLATRYGEHWAIQPPLIDAIHTNSELERPHIVVRDGLYYLFWSTQSKRFAPGIAAPTGLYGMVADRIEGPWTPLNDSGLVAANPVAEPYQAYCWWVTGDGAVISFVDYHGLGGGSPLTDAAYRRAHFGGTVAPRFGLDLDGARTRIVAPPAPVGQG